MTVLTEFNEQVEMAVRQQNGARLRELLRMNSPDAAAAMHEYVTNGGACPSPMLAPWGPLPTIVQKRHFTAAAIAACNWVDAYTHLTECVLEYIGILQSDTSWSLPLLHAFCADLRTMAVQADNQLVDESCKAEKVEDVARTLLKAFAVTNGDRSYDGSASKRVGVLEVINQLFRVYFDLNALRLCTNLTRTVNAPGFIDFETSFPVAHRVTYKYFVGRLHLYEDRYEEAVECLTYAVERIPPEFEVNKRLLLLYLIPAKILRGSLPSRTLLARYNMLWFVDITRALRSGNLSLFTSAVNKHESFFIRKGLYLAIEKMRSLVYRSLCQKLYQARVALKKKDPHKVKLSEYQMSLHMCDSSASENEVECILANLIYNGFVKGYLSHKFGYLVLSTSTPFPQLITLQAH
jgi:nuclear mRNA export protein PCID2/THP1